MNPTERQQNPPPLPPEAPLPAEEVLLRPKPVEEAIPVVQAVESRDEIPTVSAASSRHQRTARRVPPPQPVPPRKSSWLGWAIGLSVTGFLVLVLCGGGALVLVTMRQVTKGVEEELRDNQTLVSHLGTIEKGSFALNWSASMQDSDSDIWVYNVKGTKGEGKVIVKSTSIDWDIEEIIWARLQLPSGQTVDLVPTGRDPQDRGR